MFLTEPDQTPMDLRFRIFGTHVRVHPLFWLVTVILGWNVTHRPVLPGNGLGDLALWVFCVFASILLHELGHVWMGRIFRSDGHIVLYGMGGLAIGSNALSARWQRILVSFAGPGIQLFFWALLTAVLWLRLSPLEETLFWRVLPQSPLAAMALLTGERTPLGELLWMLLEINLLWPLLNLLPIWPLDGGMISREVCTGAAGENGFLVSLWISLVVAGGLAVNSLAAHFGQPHLPYLPGDVFLAILFALFAFDNLRAIQSENMRRRQSYSDSNNLPWER